MDFIDLAGAETVTMREPKKVLPLSKSSSLKGFSRTSSSFG